MEGKKFVTLIEMETNDEVTCQQIFLKKNCSKYSNRICHYEY